MHNNQLVNFLTIIECGSINKAADRLYMSQSTLSQQLKKLEEEIGTSLFERDGKKLVLTPEGKVLAEYAEKQANALNKTLNKIKAMKYGDYSELSIGIAQTSLIPDTAKWIGKMHEKHPRIKCDFVNFNFLKIMELLDTKMLDVVITRQISSDADFLANYEYKEIKKHGVVALVPPKYDFGDIKEISLQDIDGMDVILRNKHDQRFLEKCARYNSVPIVRAQCRNNLLKLALVKNNVGIGFFVDSILNSSLIVCCDIKCYRVKEIKMINKTYVVYPKAKKNAPTIKCLLDAIFSEEG